MGQIKAKLADPRQDDWTGRFFEFVVITYALPAELLDEPDYQIGGQYQNWYYLNAAGHAQVYNPANPPSKFPSPGRLILQPIYEEPIFALTASEIEDRKSWIAPVIPQRPVRRFYSSPKQFDAARPDPTGKYGITSGELVSIIAQKSWPSDWQVFVGSDTSCPVVEVSYAFGVPGVPPSVHIEFMPQERVAEWKAAVPVVKPTVPGK